MPRCLDCHHSSGPSGSLFCPVLAQRVADEYVCHHYVYMEGKADGGGETIPEAPTEGGPYGRHGGSWEPVLSNSNPIVAEGWLTFGADQSGVRFYGDGRIYKDAGGGMVLQKPQGGQQWGIEDYGAKNRVNVATEPWVDARIAAIPPVAGTTSATVGDVKQGFQGADHGGWIRLDGRAVTGLTATQQEAAAGLGFAENLPDATGSVLMQDGELLGTVGGSMTRTIGVANLPAMTLTSSEAGGHNHIMQSNINDQGVQNFNEMLAGFGGADPGSVYPAIKWRGSATIANTANNGTVLNGYAMDGAADHAHQVELGGEGQPLDVTPKAMSVNCFVWLGD